MLGSYGSHSVLVRVVTKDSFGDESSTVDTTIRCHVLFSDRRVTTPAGEDKVAEATLYFKGDTVPMAYKDRVAVDGVDYRPVLMNRLRGFGTTGYGWEVLVV